MLNRPTPRREAPPSLPKVLNDAFKEGTWRGQRGMHRMTPHVPRHASAPSSDPQPILRMLRSMMPGVGGVVLADAEGVPIAHDLPTDPRPLAASALRERAAHESPCSGTLVPWGATMCLVVFMTPATAQRLTAERPRA